jgi:hypothetical protein
LRDNGTVSKDRLSNQGHPGPFEIIVPLFLVFPGGLPARLSTRVTRVTRVTRRSGGPGCVARRQPLVGVPDPTATANTCSAVIPLPALALTVGSVTDATVLPAASGTDAK